MTEGLTRKLEQLIAELRDRDASLRLTKNGGLSVFPQSRLNKNLLKRIKKHKKDLIAMLRAMGELEQSMDAVLALPVCEACEELIPHDAPYVAIEKDGTGEQEHFHIAPECQEPGAKKLASTLERGEIYWMHLVHACGDEKSGYACAGGCFR
jgi:hypothetical protein